jgi:hypothetical protein
MVSGNLFVEQIRLLIFGGFYTIFQRRSLLYEAASAMSIVSVPVSSCLLSFGTRKHVATVIHGNGI